MAQFPVKIPANIGLATPVPATGTVTNVGTQINSGTYNPIWAVTYQVSGTPAAVTTLPVLTLPATATLVGISGCLGATGASTAVSIQAVKVGAAAEATTNLLTTAMAFGNSAALSAQGQWTLNGVTTTFQPTVTTNLTAPVLKTDGSCQFVAGDTLAVTTSGTFTGASNLLVTFYVRDDSGSI